MLKKAIFLTAAMSISTMAFAADATGKWTASIDTNVGVQEYTYDLKVDGTKVTGTTKSETGETEIENGEIHGDEISFTEYKNFTGATLKIVYAGKIVGDEIQFNRQIEDYASEDFVAKRVQ